MALLFKNFSKNLVTLRPFKSVCKNNLRIIVLRLTQNDLTIQVNFSQPTQSLHQFVVLSEKKMEKIKEKLKVQDYTSLRKKIPVCDVWEGMTIEELSKAMGKDVDHVFELMSYCDNTVDYKSPHDVLDWAVLTDILTKARMRFRIVPKSKENIEEEDHDVYPYPQADESKLKRRPAVVTIMGHVDHGKTTLLDYLRRSSIVESEFGGITQHIGAFSVRVGSDSITFLDTPGHAAFKSMRNRGAHCTDIIVLVVAADDGVMEQTVESIKMAKDANVPIIVAINKIDKGNANIEMTKKMLSAQGLVPEDYGGDVQCVPISALKGTNINALTEAIITQAELSNLRADPEGFVEGVVLESKIDVHKGKLSTALIKRGTLKNGCFLTAGLAWCKVKRMLDERQCTLHQAPPSTPVEIVGWRMLPMPGDIIIEVPTEGRAREVIEFREKKAKNEKALQELPEIERRRQEHLMVYKPILLEKRKLGIKKLKRTGPPEKQDKNDTVPRLSIIIKCDVEGSLEAILDCLHSYYDPRCKLDIVEADVGSITPSDIELAESFNAIIYNFNTSVLPEAAQLAENENIPIRQYNIIYRFLEDVKKELNSRLPSIEKEEVTAEAVVLELFLITEGKKKNVPVAGCRCISGELKKQSMYKVIRNGVEVFRGKLCSMRNQKLEVTAIKKHQECGLRFEDSSFAVKPGDIIQAYRTYNEPQELKWDPFVNI